MLLKIRSQRTQVLDFNGPKRIDERGYLPLSLLEGTLICTPMQDINKDMILKPGGP